MSDPIIDRARAVYLYIVAAIAFQQGVVNYWFEMLGRPVRPMSLQELGIIVSPAVVYMFARSWEHVVASKSGGTP